MPEAIKLVSGLALAKLLTTQPLLILLHQRDPTPAGPTNKANGEQSQWPGRQGVSSLSNLVPTFGTTETESEYRRKRTTERKG